MNRQRSMTDELVHIHERVIKKTTGSRMAKSTTTGKINRITNLFKTGVEVQQDVRFQSIRYVRKIFSSLLKAIFFTIFDEIDVSLKTAP